MEGVVVLRWSDRRRKRWDVMFNPTVGEGGSRRYVSVLLSSRDDAVLKPDVLHALAEDLPELLSEDAQTRGELAQWAGRAISTSGARPGPDPKRSAQDIERVYNAAVDDGEPPVATVARRFGISRQQASREVKRARERGADLKSRRKRS